MSWVQSTTSDSNSNHLQSAKARRQIVAWRNLCFSALFTAMLALISGGAVAQDNSGNTNMPDFRQVQKQAMELKQSMLTYGENQRQQLLSETESALASFDQRIDRLQATIDAREQDMSRAAQRYTDNLMNTLERQRVEFGNWLSNLRTESDTAWDQVMYGFSEAYDQFYNSWENLESEFGEDTY